LRILMTADSVGGVWTYACELIAAIGEDADVVLAVMGPRPNTAQRRRLAGLPLAGYAECSGALEWMEDPWDDVARAGSWLLELQRAHDAELVHLNGFVHASLPFGVPVVVVGHSCVLSWHDAVRGRPAGPEWGRYRSEVQRGLASADAVVAPTAAMLAELARLYRPQAEMFVIPNGIERRDLGPGDKRRWVLGVGRFWDEAKNLAALERVAPRTRWPVLVAGEGASLGPIDDSALRTLYRHAAIFAEPARYEPFGLAALEAGRCGCALVLGDIPSLREVWSDAAVYVDPFDDDALAAALADVIEDDRWRRELGAAALERAGIYSRDRMAAAYLDLYREVRAVGRLEAAV
jgi:glycosyltransferase involved in cell wall biosynthesis